MPGDLPPAWLAVQTGRGSYFAIAVDTSVLFIPVAIAGCGLLAWLLLGRYRHHRHHREVRQLLDAADSLEARLRTARSEITAVAGEHRGDPVHEAMREMLRQRLWLREHGDGASVHELRRVRGSIEAARQRIDHQLDKVREARVAST